MSIFDVPIAELHEPNELAHFGVKGMKWGRRKQRPHGNGRQGRMSARQKRARDMSNMSDVELQRYLNRRRMESEYHKMNRTKGEKFRSWAVGVGKQAAERAAKRAANQLIDTGLQRGGDMLRSYGPSALAGARNAASRAKSSLSRPKGKELTLYDPSRGGQLGPRKVSGAERARQAVGGFASKARSAASRAGGQASGYASRAKGGLGGFASKARSAASRAKGGMRRQPSSKGKDLVLYNTVSRGQAATEALRRKRRGAYRQGRPGTTGRPRRSYRQRG